MDPRALMAVIVKAAGLLLLLYVLMQLPDRVVGYLLSTEKSGYLFLGVLLVPIAVPLAVGAFLFWFPATVASVVGGTRSVDNPAMERMLQAVIFAGIGLYTALQSAVMLAYYFSFSAHMRNDYAGAPFDDPSIKASVFANVVGVVVGVVLLIGARGIAALLAKLRHSQ